MTNYSIVSSTAYFLKLKANQALGQWLPWEDQINERKSFPMLIISKAFVNCCISSGDSTLYIYLLLDRFFQRSSASQPTKYQTIWPCEYLGRIWKILSQNWIRTNHFKIRGKKKKSFKSLHGYTIRLQPKRRQIQMALAVSCCQNMWNGNWTVVCWKNKEIKPNWG